MLQLHAQLIFPSQCCHHCGGSGFNRCHRCFGRGQVSVSYEKNSVALGNLLIIEKTRICRRVKRGFGKCPTLVDLRRRSERLENVELRSISKDKVFYWKQKFPVIVDSIVIYFVCLFVCLFVCFCLVLYRCDARHVTARDAELFTVMETLIERLATGVTAVGEEGKSWPRICHYWSQYQHHYRHH